jgi:hypothetical protein
MRMQQPAIRAKKRYHYGYYHKIIIYGHTTTENVVWKHVDLSTLHTSIATPFCASYYPRLLNPTLRLPLHPEKSQLRKPP